MNWPLAVAALLLSVITFAPAAIGQTSCSCKAPDKSCTAAVTCQQAGAAICGSNSACYAACGGVEADDSYARISLKLDKKSGDEVTAALRHSSRRNIVFIPRRKTDRFTLELKNHPVWNALKFLNRRGQVLVDGTPFSKLEELRRSMLRGGKVSVNFSGVTVRDAVAKLSFISGLLFRVESRDAERLLSISLEEVTLGEIVSRISAETGVKIERAWGGAQTK